MFTLIALFACNSQEEITQLNLELEVTEMQIEMVERQRDEAHLDCHDLADKYRAFENNKSVYEAEAAKRNLDDYPYNNPEIVQMRMEADAAMVASLNLHLQETKKDGDRAIARWAELEWVQRTLQNEQRQICSDLRPHAVDCDYMPSSLETDLSAIKKSHIFPNCP